MTGTVSWILSLKAITDALIGLGVIKGKNCQVKSIVRNGRATVITFAWYDEDEELQEMAFTMYDGVDGINGVDGQDGAPGDPGANGVSVVSAEITDTHHLVFTMSNDTTIDAGVISGGGGEGGSDVIANPELEGDETELESLGIDGTNYKLATGGTNVIANPVMTGTEEIATGIQIGSEKFVFPSTSTYGFTASQISMLSGILHAGLYSSDQSSAIDAFITSLSEIPEPTEKVLESITAVINNPTVEQGTTYVPNVSVTAHYDDGTTANVSAQAVFGTIDTATTGEKTLTISYTENEVTKTTSGTVTVTAEPVPVVLSSISATKTKMSYTTEETFSTDDVVVTAHYSDGSSANVTSSATIGTVDISTTGTKTLNISYTEDAVTKTATLSITVTEAGGKEYLENHYLSDRRINGGVIGNHTGDKLTYVSVEAGVTYNTDVTDHLYFGDSTAKDTEVTQIDFPYTPSSNGYIMRSDSSGAQLDLKVYVSSSGQKTLESITATKTKTTYEVDEAFSSADVVVTAHYSDSTTANVTSSATIGTVDTSTEGSKTLSISYTEDGVTKSTSIAITVGTVPSVELVYKYGKRSQAYTDHTMTTSSKSYACTIGSADASAPLIGDVGIHAIPRGNLTHYSYPDTEHTTSHASYYTPDNGATWYFLTNGVIPDTATHIGFCVKSSDETTSASTYSAEIEGNLILS